MNKITNLTVQGIAGAPTAGIKGRTFSDDLSGVDVWCGENGAGKTTRIIALLGAIHGLARTTTDPHRPFVDGGAHGTEAVVHTTGGDWRRDLGVINPSAGSHKRATVDAHGIVGAPVVSWDLSSWSTATDGGRRRLLSQIAKAGGAVESWTPRDAQQHLRTEVDGIDGASAMMLELVTAHPSGADAATWLDAADVWTQGRAKSARADVRHAEAVFAERQESRGDAPAGDRSAIADQLDALRHRLSDMGRATARFEQHADDIVSAQGRLDDVTERGKALRSATPPTPPTRDGVIGAEARLLAAQNALNADIPALPQPEPIDPELSLTVDRCERADALAISALEQARETYRTAFGAMHAAQGAHDAYASASAAYGIIQVQAQAPCRHCGTPDPMGTMAGHDEPTRPASNVDALRTASADANAARVNAAQHARTTSAALRTAQTALATAEGASLPVDDASRIARIQSQRQNDVDRAATSLAAAEQCLSEDSARHLATVERRASELAQLKIEWRRAQSRLTDLQSMTLTASDPSASMDLRGQIATMQAQHDIWRDYDRAGALLESAGHEVTAAHVHRKCCDAIVEGIRAVRLAQASACYQPVADAACALLADAWDGSPQPYLRGPGDYGAVVHGHAVRFESLSESEKRITAAALVYALAVVSRQPCRLVLIDGLEVVQPSHRAPLLAVLARAHEAGLVDNVMVTCATDCDEDVDALRMPGVTVHHLTNGPTPAPSPSPAPAPATVASQVIQVTEDDDACPF